MNEKLRGFAEDHSDEIKLGAIYGGSVLAGLGLAVLIQKWSNKDLAKKIVKVMKA